MQMSQTTRMLTAKAALYTVYLHFMLRELVDKSAMQCVDFLYITLKHVNLHDTWWFAFDETWWLSDIKGTTRDFCFGNSVLVNSFYFPSGSNKHSIPGRPFPGEPLLSCPNDKQFLKHLKDCLRELVGNEQNMSEIPAQIKITLVPLLEISSR